MPPQQTNTFNPLLLLAPGMALVFLMFTVSLGSRSILVERREGTLARMLSTATGGGPILVGKITGVYLVGAAQMFILIVASALLFRLSWGDPLGVIAAGAGGGGRRGRLGPAAGGRGQDARPGGQHGHGHDAALRHAGRQLLRRHPDRHAWSTVGKITPNAWAMDGFTTLARGGDLADLVPDHRWPCWLMGAILLTISVVLFNRKGFLQR